MLVDREGLLSKSIVKFIDIVLDLYSPVPYEIRNEMRVLQNTLLYGQSKQLEDYIITLSDKLQNKAKFKQEQYQIPELANSNPILQKSATKITKNPLFDSDKQNKFYLNNLKTHVSDGLKSKQNSFNATALELGKNRKISAVEYLNRDEDAVNQSKGLIKDVPELGKTTSRALLKIVKRNRSSKQKHPLTERSL